MRCAACSAVWRATVEDLADSVDPTDPLSETVDPLAIEAAGVAAPSPSEAARVGGSPRGFAAWGVAAGVLAGVFAAALVFRTELVRIWPQAASAYALVGLSTTSSGLVIAPDSVVARRDLVDGREVLEVSALVRNPGDAARRAPLLRVQVRNRQGMVVMDRLAALSVVEVDGRGIAEFTAVFADPPGDGVDVDLFFTKTFPDAGAQPVDAGAAEPDAAGEAAPDTGDDVDHGDPPHP